MTRRRAFAIFFFSAIAALPAFEPATKPSVRKPEATPPVAKAKPVMTTERMIAQRWLRGLSLRDRVAQLIMIKSYGEAPSSRSAAFREYVHLVRDLKVGGMIVVNRVVGGSVRSAEPYAMAAFLNRMQRLATIPS